jgi:hypothetical protein
MKWQSIGMPALRRGNASQGNLSKVTQNSGAEESRAWAVGRGRGGIQLEAA